MKKQYKHSTLTNIARLAAVAVGCSLSMPGFTQQTVTLNGVPDFDQKWSTLPNDGENHCVPTCFTDMMVYFGTRGYSDLLFHPADPNGAYLASNNQSVVNAGVVLRINSMGNYCQTDQNTQSDNAYSGLRQFIKDRIPNVFSVNQYIRGKNFPHAGTLFNWLSDGDMVTFDFGRYDDDLDRVSGHASVAVGLSGTWVDITDPHGPNIPYSAPGYKRDLEDIFDEQMQANPYPDGYMAYTIKYHNPYSGDSLTDQSPLKIVSKNMYRDYNDWGITQGGCYALDRISGIGEAADGTTAYIDGYTRVSAAKVVSSSQGLSSDLINVFHSRSFKELSVSEIETYDVRVDDPSQPVYGFGAPENRPGINSEAFKEDYELDDLPILTSLTWLPVHGHVLLTVEGGNGIFIHNRHSNVTKKLFTLPFVPKQVHISRDAAELYVLGNGKLVRCDMEGISTLEPAINAEIEVLSDVKSIVDDPVSGLLVAAGSNRLVFLNRDLQQVGQMAVEGLRVDRPLTLRASAETGEIFAMSEGIPNILKLVVNRENFTLADQMTIPLTGATAPSSFDLLQDGSFLVSDNGHGALHLRNGLKIEGSLWDSMVCGRLIELTKDVVLNPGMVNVSNAVEGQTDEF